MVHILSSGGGGGSSDIMLMTLLLIVKSRTVIRPPKHYQVGAILEHDCTTGLGGKK